MRGEPTGFWGKLRRGHDGTCQWHPLPDQCADVAAVTQALLELPVWRARLSRPAGAVVSEPVWARLCVPADLHDIGKCVRDTSARRAHLVQLCAMRRRPFARFTIAPELRVE